MNKADLIDIIANDVEITKLQADATINAFTSAVISTLRKGESVTLAGFGTFMITNRAARNGRNPQTGATIKIKATKVPKFKAGKGFSELINKKK